MKFNHCRIIFISILQVVHYLCNYYHLLLFYFIFYFLKLLLLFNFFILLANGLPADKPCIKQICMNVCTMPQRRPLSKTEPKFCTFWPPKKFRGGVGKMYEWINQVQPTTKPLIHFAGSPLSRFGQGLSNGYKNKERKKEKTEEKHKACQYMSCSYLLRQFSRNSASFATLCINKFKSLWTAHACRNRDRRTGLGNNVNGA